MVTVDLIKRFEILQRERPLEELGIFDLSSLLAEPSDGRIIPRFWAKAHRAREGRRVAL